MPRKAKDETVLTEENKVKKAPSTKKKTTKSASTTVKKTTKKSTKSEAKTTTEKKETKTTKPASTKKKVSTAKKTSTTTKKASSQKAKSVKSEKTTKAVKENKTKKTSSKTTKKTPSKKIEVIEYYDLPYRYNQTVVKILAQTPTTLFVYWDVSDEDKKKYIETYGEYFFNNTKPVLIVHNKTTNSSFELDINDFANSWYLHVLDSDNDYQIELGRRPVNEYVSIENDYLYITSSNEIEMPNDHILFDHLTNNIYFRNVKTNYTVKKENVNLSLLTKVGNISKIKAFYKELYPNEFISFDRLDISNPSSGNSTSTFK